MKEKKTKVDTRQLEISSTKTLIDAIGEEEKKLIAKTTVSTDVDDWFWVKLRQTKGVREAISQYGSLWESMLSYSHPL